MPQPRQMQQTEPPPGPGAVAATALPTATAELGTTLAAVGAGVLSAAAAAGAIKVIVEAYEALAKKRFNDGGVFVMSELQREYPDRPPSELAKLLAQEEAFEEEFQRKMRERLLRDLPEALAITDPADRQAAVTKILERERGYVISREEAMFLRALGKADMLRLKESSPLGAYWKLSPFVREHTLDCLAMGERFWPWEVLEHFQPPVHHGCACYLLGLDEAVAEGLMTPDQVPDTRDAIRRYRQAMQDVRDMEESLEESVIRAYIEERAVAAENVVPFEKPDRQPPVVLQEATAARNTGAMVALYPPKKLAQDFHVEGGEPAEDLHVTLAFLGKAKAIKDPKKLIDAVKGFASSCAPFEGEVSGIGLFTAGPKPVTYASVDLPRLPAARERLVSALKGAGAPPSAEHGFTPHMTLAYDDLNVPFMAGEVQTPKLKFEYVTLKLGDRRYDFPLKGEPLEEAGLVERLLPGRKALRWEKGVEHGGQFRPQRGGDPGRRLRKLFPHPTSPAALRGERRGRWAWVNGVYTRIPDADHWERKIAGHTYMSPPGSTNVYKDGALLDGLGAESPERRGRPGGRKTPDALRKKADPIRAELRAAAADRIQSTSPAHPPVAVGDGPSSLLALRELGYHVEQASPGTLLFRNGRTGNGVSVGFDGKQIAYVGWEPSPQPTPEGKRLLGPPHSWEEHRDDAFAWAHEIAGEHGVPSVRLPDLQPDGSLPDHAGIHMHTGETYVGQEAADDIDRAGSARAAGRPLSIDERRGVWSAYWVTAHEAVGHSVNQIDQHLYYQDQHKNLEEALAEELAHVEAVKRLQTQGQKDVLAWRNANPQHPAVRGVYRSQRAALGRLLDRAGITDQFDRRVFVEDLKYRTDPADRFQVLGEALRANGVKGDTVSDAEDAMLSARGDGVALDPMRASPGLEQVGHLAYGRFAGARLSSDGKVLTLADGGTRRVEKLPLLSDELTGLTDGSAVVAYRRGQKPTSALENADGSAKNFRYVDSQERGKTILRAFAGMGAPGAVRDLWEPGDQAPALEQKLAGAGSGWTTIRGVPIKRRFDGSYGVGNAGFDGRRLSGVAGEKAAVATALQRAEDDPSWAPAAGMASPGAGWGGGNPPSWWKKLTHSGQGDLFAGEQEALDKAFGESEKPKKKAITDPLVGRKIGGDPSAAPPTGRTPAYDQTELTLGNTAGGSNGARWAFDENGHRWLVKSYRGNQDRIATELLANAVYRRLGAKAATAGTITMPPGKPDFRQVKDADIGEPPLPKKEKGKRVSAGVMVVEPDGRVWIVEPKNHFGGYEHTFPKGGVEHGMTGQQTALKELWEETGLHAAVTGYVGDYEGDTGVTRMYLAVRTGGEPHPDDLTPHQKGSGKEMQAVKLVTTAQASEMLNRDRDKAILKDALAEGLPKGDPPPDPFPEPQSSLALTYPTLEGDVRERFKPSEKLGEHYMADALLANWDFVGMTGDNILWDENGDPIRIDQGGTLEFRAQGQSKPFGPVPTEVWTMLSKGQGKRGVIVDEEQMKAQAGQIAKRLTPARIDSLVDEAPFRDEQMRDRVRENLKARVGWMRDFAAGKVELPQPAEGEAAHDLLLDAQKDFKVYPEEEAALHAFLDNKPEFNTTLKKGEKIAGADKTIKNLDTLLGAAKTPDDVIGYAPLNLKGDDLSNLGKGLVDKTLQESGYLGLHLEDPGAPAALRLTVPAGSRALYAAMFDDLPAGAPDLLVARKAKVKITGRRESDGRVILDGILSTK